MGDRDDEGLIVDFADWLQDHIHLYLPHVNPLEVARLQLHVKAEWSDRLGRLDVVEIADKRTGTILWPP